MTVHTPIVMQPSSGDASLVYSGQELRQLSAALLTTARGGIAAGQGVNIPTAWKVTQRGLGANLTVDVAAGLAWVLGDDVTSQGPYLVWNDGTVNVGPFSVPSSGTYNHRLVLQIEDKLENGVWSGYQAVPVIVPDTGGGLPAEPPSAITLAAVVVPASAASITNTGGGGTGSIVDYREMIGDIPVTKPADTPRTNNTMSDDPDLQFLNLAANAEYEFEGALIFNGNSGGGDIQWTWRASAGLVMAYHSIRNFVSGGSLTSTAVYGVTDNPSAQANGTASNQSQFAKLEGRISTGAGPAYTVLQWAQNTANGGTPTKLLQRSWLRARRVA